MRPGDGTETAGCYRAAVLNTKVRRTAVTLLWQWQWTPNARHVVLLVVSRTHRQSCAQAEACPLAACQHQQRAPVLHHGAACAGGACCMPAPTRHMAVTPWSLRKSNSKSFIKEIYPRRRARTWRSACGRPSWRCRGKTCPTWRAPLSRASPRAPTPSSAAMTSPTPSCLPPVRSSQEPHRKPLLNILLDFVVVAGGDEQVRLRRPRRQCSACLCSQPLACTDRQTPWWPPTCMLW